MQINFHLARACPLSPSIFSLKLTYCHYHKTFDTNFTNMYPYNIIHTTISNKQIKFHNFLLINLIYLNLFGTLRRAMRRKTSETYTTTDTRPLVDHNGLGVTLPKRGTKEMLGVFLFFQILAKHKKIIQMNARKILFLFFIIFNYENIKML